ncbi:hypothetical protein [Bacillus phage BC-T25]|nr:hypothetical protein [Bacillus phage BC-T25]
MNGTVACPYCNNEQYVEFNTNGRWELPKCADCKQVFYARIIFDYDSSALPHNGILKEPTYICPKE